MKQIPIIIQVKYRGGKRLICFKENTRDDCNCLTTLCGRNTLDAMNLNAILVTDNADADNIFKTKER